MKPPPVKSKNVPPCQRRDVQVHPVNRPVKEINHRHYNITIAHRKIRQAIHSMGKIKAKAEIKPSGIAAIQCQILTGLRDSSQDFPRIPVAGFCASKHLVLNGRIL